MDEQALKLLSEANAVLARTDRGATFWYDSQRKAVQISDFLSANGEGLDANDQGWIVDQLGQAVDALTSGARVSLGAAQKSPTDAFFGSLKQDAETGLKFGLPIAGLAAAILLIILLRR